MNIHLVDSGFPEPGGAGEIRNICRCGTYNRIREAIYAGAENM